MRKESIKTNEKPYVYCDRCKIDNNGNDRMCPCPRGSCEAEIIGTIITTVEVKITLKPVIERPVLPNGSVEEMSCNSCGVVTGHHVIKDKWTCVHCGNQK
jgi:hypothetical protein